MTRLELEYVHRFKDRHGKVRHYFRRAGYPSATLPGEVGSEEFMTAYAVALGKAPKPIIKYAKGTIGALIPAWYQSTKFGNLAASTQGVYRNIAERFGAEYASLPVDQLETHHIDRIVAKKVATPGAAKNLLKVLRLLLAFAKKDRWISSNPAAEAENVTLKSDGHHSWAEEEIAQFEAHWAIGTRERLALALFLYTAQRKSDVVRMGRQHERNGLISVRQQKTGAFLEIPVHPELKAVLDASPAQHLTYLITKAGAPFTAAGFGNWFREACDAAGLPGCSSHGLRKAQSRRLAEAGCSEFQIASITGHESMNELRKYTKAARQKGLAEQAMSMLTSAVIVEGPGNPLSKPVANLKEK